MKRPDVTKLFDPAQIDAEVERIASLINHDYAGKDIVLVGCLTGAFVFMADLMRKLDLDAECDFIKVSSYEDRMVPGAIKLEMDLTRSIENRHVIVIEDIVDTGQTLAFIRGHLAAKRPKSLDLCVLLYKESRRCTLPKEDVRYVGFTVPDIFVVGYGIDYARKFRPLPYVGHVKSS